MSYLLNTTDDNVVETPDESLTVSIYVPGMFPSFLGDLIAVVEIEVGPPSFTQNTATSVKWNVENRVKFTGMCLLWGGDTSGRDELRQSSIISPRPLLSFTLWKTETSEALNPHRISTRPGCCSGGRDEHIAWRGRQRLLFVFCGWCRCPTIN